VTVFEVENKPGGMLYSAIPAYRLPREIIEKEIESLLDENITLKCDTALGVHITIDGLFSDGFKAVFLAIGAHKSRMLKIDGEESDGVYPSIQFLKDFNLRGKSQAKGRVGVIGGGNSAIDAARVALRQKGVTGVTIFYRRTREEMPAFQEEIDDAIQEGANLETLISPVKIFSKESRLTGVEFIQNTLGDVDASGRRRPLPVTGSEQTVPLDTLIVAISEGSDVDCVSVASSQRIETTKWDTVQVDTDTLRTNLDGVFSGGDVIRGPDTVVNAIADGKRAALMIDRYLRGEDLVQPAAPQLPEIYVEPVEISEEEEMELLQRVVIPRASVEWRKRGFAEVEMSLTEEEAQKEAQRCLRCDLEFTQPDVTENELPAKEENIA
jgi:NADH-quinone oxidoreductase subunit F